eukprot:m.364925 g.364925  ORF g.364925 m.364925 type:complete len:57 (+) comp29096_c0_seq1:34-204(+)
MLPPFASVKAPGVSQFYLMVAQSMYTHTHTEYTAHRVQTEHLLLLPLIFTQYPFLF